MRQIACARNAFGLPAYDQCMKASHLFNLLDARGVISVTERQSYIGRESACCKGCCEAWVANGQTQDSPTQNRLTKYNTADSREQV